MVWQLRRGFPFALCKNQWFKSPNHLSKPSHNPSKCIATFLHFDGLSLVCRVDTNALSIGMVEKSQEVLPGSRFGPGQKENLPLRFGAGLHHMPDLFYCIVRHTVIMRKKEKKKKKREKRGPQLNESVPFRGFQNGVLSQPRVHESYSKPGLQLVDVSRKLSARTSLKMDFFCRTYWVCSRIAILHPRWETHLPGKRLVEGASSPFRIS